MMIDYWELKEWHESQRRKSGTPPADALLGTAAEFGDDPGSDSEETPASCDVEYLPTPEQIRETCLQIQSEWSEGERRRRAGLIAHHNGHSMSVPVSRLLVPV